VHVGPGPGEQPSGWSIPAIPAIPPPPSRTARGLVIGVLLLAAVAIGSRGTPAPASLALPDRLHLVLAVPAGTEVPPSLIAAVEHEARLAERWLEQQAGGTFRGDLEWAEVLALDLPDQPLGGPADLATDAIEREVDRQLDDRSVLAVVVTTMATDDPTGPNPCGMGGPLGVVVYLGNCGPPPSSATDAFGRGMSRVIAHEVVHALGGVPDCAPNAADGHVTDDPADLMTPEFIAGSGTAVLDAAGDDYLGRGAPVCADIMDSPLWDRRG
jgi:hypothetical protein